MAFSAGRKLGPYEILGPLGAGGMGEVYRARDTRLGREVALKVMPSELASDAGRRARFEQEARAVAALNHPGIVAVHDIGSGDDGVLYMVTELVDGVTLRQALNDSGPMVPRKAVELGAEIADAVAAAHARGITHRDLKPENIMVTREGRAKVLDFGLAKNTGAKLGAKDSTLTAMAVNTDPGTVMGTVGYMSPEQVRGQDADARSDVFSFGAVLHEMLSGKRAFAKESAAETMTAIVREDVAELPESIPSGLRQVTGHCLEKEPGRRFQSMKDLAFGLRAMGLSTSSSQALPATVEPGRPQRLRWILPAACAVCLAGGWALAPREEITGNNLKVWPIAQSEATETSPVFSPDGKSIAYTTHKGQRWQLLVRVLEAEQPAVLAEGVFAASGLEPNLFWSADGGRLYFENKGGLWQVGVSGGAATPVFPKDGMATLMPGGKAILLARVDGVRMSFWVSDPAGSEPRFVKEIASTETGPQVMKFSADGKKLAVRSSGDTFRLVQWPSGSFEDLAVTGLPRSVVWFADSRHLLLTKLLAKQITIYDTESGAERVIHASHAEMTKAALAPDGRRIAFSAIVRKPSIFEYANDGRLLRPLSNSTAGPQYPRWSPDGRSLVFPERQSLPGSSFIFVRDDVAGATRKIGATASTGLAIQLELSPDSKRIAYPNAGKLWTLSMAGGLPLAIADMPRGRVAWSPDGAWVAFQTPQGVYKVPSQGGATTAQLYSGGTTGTTGGVMWLGDGIYFMLEGKLIRVPAQGGQPVQVAEFPGALLMGASRDAARLHLLRSREDGHDFVVVNVKTGVAEKTVEIQTEGTVRSLSVHPDGKRIAAWVVDHGSDLWMLEGFPRPTVGFERLFHKWVEPK